MIAVVLLFAKRRPAVKRNRQTRKSVLAAYHTRSASRGAENPFALPNRHVEERMKANFRRSIMMGTIGLAGMGLGCSAAAVGEEEIDYENLPAVVVDFSRPIAGLTAAQLTAFNVGEE